MDVAQFSISRRSETSSPRPFWSVMIPTYRPDPGYLEQALESVLQQAPRAEQMQIEVVDDCSPRGDVKFLVRSIAGDRVSFSRTSKSLGLAGCWNSCIERASGEWVHILHQDDLVLPGFYTRFESLIENIPELDAAFSRYLYADADGHWRFISALEMRNAGELQGFDKLLATWTRIQCAAVVVKRSTYERLGGYRGDIPYVLDWELWCRIAALGRWGYVPQAGAVYRSHMHSETQRLLHSGATFRDLLVGGQIARAHFSRELQAETVLGYQNEFTRHLLDNANELHAKGSIGESAAILDSFRSEIMKSRYRRTWLRLRMRLFIEFCYGQLVSYFKSYSVKWI